MPSWGDLPTVWAGHQLDAATGLYHMQARWYDPRTGQFLTPDPIRFAAGDSNLYRYVSNDPTNAVDPTGLAGYFFDGTGNSEFNEGSLTNVYRLFQAYNAGLAFYANGIGSGYDADGSEDSSWHFEWYQNATGATMDNRIDFMISKLEKQLANDDKVIDLFGFSRGSATAVRFLQQVQEKIDEDNPLYDDIEVRFVALFDSVPSYKGIIRSGAESTLDYAGMIVTLGFWQPNHYARQSDNRGFQFPKNMTFTHTPLHLIAVDEQRKEFAVTDLERAEQIGFRGVHSDVGGGYGGNIFEFISREFVFEESKRLGLSLFDEKVIRSFNIGYRGIYDVMSNMSVGLIV